MLLIFPIRFFHSQADPFGQSKFHVFRKLTASALIALRSMCFVQFLVRSPPPFISFSSFRMLSV